MVRRGRKPRPRPRDRDPLPRAGLPGVPHGRRRTGAPQLWPARAAGAGARGGLRRLRLGRPPRRQPVDPAPGSHARTRRHRDPSAGRADGREPARSDRVRAGGRGRGRARRPPRGPGRLGGAGRAHIRRALRRARPLARGRALRRGLAAGPAARRPGAARRGHPNLQAATGVAERGSPGSARPRRWLPRAHSPGRGGAGRFPRGHPEGARRGAGGASSAAGGQMDRGLARRRCGHRRVAGRRARPLRAAGVGRAGGGAARRRRRMAGLLDARSRRRGLLPRQARSRCASWPTAEPTGSTAPHPRPPAPRWPPAGRPSC